MSPEIALALILKETFINFPDPAQVGRAEARYSFHVKRKRGNERWCCLLMFNAQFCLSRHFFEYKAFKIVRERALAVNLGLRCGILSIKRHATFAMFQPDFGEEE